MAIFFSCAVSGLCHAGPEDALNFVVGASATYDDNLFRRPAGAPLPNAGNSSRSDMIYTAYAGIRVDRAYSLQRFQLDLTGTRYQYRSNDFLNFSAVDYRGAWLWSLTPRLTGIIAADREEFLTSYADFNSQSSRNVHTNETQRVTADWWVDSGWHLIGGAYRTRSNNTANFTAVGNYVQKTAEAGVKYVSAADNSLALVRRESRGEYSDRNLGPALLDTRYDQDETELRVLWRTSGHSSLDGRLAYLDRTHEHFAQRDYSGAVGSLTYIWTPTGALKLTLVAGRDLYSYQETTVAYSSSYYAAKYIRLTPAWMLSDKTTIRLKMDITQRDYRGAVAAAPLSRDDTVRTVQLGVTWRPTPMIDVDGHLTSEQRSSNVSDLSYHDVIAGISGTLKF